MGADIAGIATLVTVALFLGYVAFFTGLTWEVKSDQAGLHDWRNTYSWWDPKKETIEFSNMGCHNLRSTGTVKFYPFVKVMDFSLNCLRRIN